MQNKIKKKKNREEERYREENTMQLWYDKNTLCKQRSFLKIKANSEEEWTGKIPYLFFRKQMKGKTKNEVRK